MRCLRPFPYLWASPGSLIGLLLTLVALMTGGRARVVSGVLEAHGGWVTLLLHRGNRWTGSIAAITLGHVVLGYELICCEHEGWEIAVLIKLSIP